MYPLSFVLCLFFFFIVPQSQDYYNSHDRITDIECIETEFDFNRFLSSDKCSHTFVIKNTSKEDIVVQQVCTTCSCISVSWDKKIVRAGESTAITATYYSPSYKGSFNKSIIVYLSNMKRPFLLRIKGEAI